MATSIRVDAIVQLLIVKGIFTKKEFFDMLNQVQMDCQRRKNNAGNNSS